MDSVDISICRMDSIIMDSNFESCSYMQNFPNIPKANFLMSINGVVVHGKGFGRFLSIPTANINTSCDISFLEEGVYCSLIKVDDIVRPGTVNIGRRPTVDNLEKITIEVNILDFNSDIYGKEVTLDVYKLLRPTQRFESLTHLICQIRNDCLATLDYFGLGLKKEGIEFKLEVNAIVFGNKTIKLDDKSTGLLFILLLNPSCVFSFEQIYQAVWHESVRRESCEKVKNLVNQVNEILHSNEVPYFIETVDDHYKIKH